MSRQTRVRKQVNYQELDSEEEITTRVERKRAVNPPKRPNKRTKQHQKAPTTAAEAGPDYVENPIFVALYDPESNVEEESRQWLELYEEAPSSAIARFINLMLRSCGCVTQVQDHDTETENQLSTVAEVVTAFSEQGYHEYPFGSKLADRKFFHENVMEFVEKLVEIAHDKGMLDDDKFMSHLLAWCTPFTSCNIRPLRHIFTVVVLLIQSSLCDAMTVIYPALEKAQRQIANASRGRSKRNTKTTVESLQFTAHTYTAQKATIETVFRIITESTFIHRYRDLDSLIRQECVKCLGYGIETCPDYFFQSSYLRYLGWLLSDPVNVVRSEVVKILSSLYDTATTHNKTLDTGFRQFTERFKSQLMLLSTRDDDAQVRLRSTSICCSLFTIGFLNENECKNLGVSILKYFAASPGSTNDLKIKERMVRFLHLVAASRAENIIQRYKTILDEYESEKLSRKLSIKNAIKVKCVIEFLHEITTDEVDDYVVLPEIFTLLSQLSDAVSWEFVVQYYLHDTSSIKFLDEAQGDQIKSYIDISEPHLRLSMALYILGSILWFYKATLLRKLDKKQDNMPESVEEIQLKLIEFLPELAKHFVKSSNQCGVFVRLWTLLLRPSPVFGSLYNGFKLIGQMHIYNDINKDLLLFFDEFEPGEIINCSILESFSEYFSVLLLAYDSKPENLDHQSSYVMTPEVRIAIQNVVISLATGVEELLKSSEELAEYSMLRLVELSNCSYKLFLMSEHIDIVTITTKKIESIQSLCMSISNSTLGRLRIEIPHEPTKDDIAKLKDIFGIIFANMSFLSNITSILLEGLIAKSFHSLNADNESDVFNIFEYVPSIFVNAIELQKQARDNTFKLSSMGPDTNTFITRQDCLGGLSEISTILASKLIDLLIPLRFFYLKSRDSNFSNFEALFSFDRLGKYVTSQVDATTEECLIFPFLIHESKLAQLKGTEIKKSDSESASIEEVAAMMVSRRVNGQSSFDLDLDEEEDEEEEGEEDAELRKEALASYEEQIASRQREQQIWNCEKDLSVYALRLLSLQRVALLPSHVVKRIEANAMTLGGTFNSAMIGRSKEASGEDVADPASE